MSQQDPRSVRERVTAELQRTRPEQEASALARTTDPALQGKTTSQAGKPVAGQVSWVPVLDVLQGQGHRLANWHAATQEQLIRRVRHGAGQVATAPARAIKTAVGNRAARKNLPPASVFGQAAPAASTQAVGS